MIAQYFILDCKCDLMVQNFSGETALHIASKTGNYPVVKMITDREDAMPAFNSVDKKGNTPLHLACLKGNLDIVKCITETYRDNCGLNERNEDGDTPLQLAIGNNHYRLISFFISLLKVHDQLDEDGNTILHIACKNDDIQLAQCLASPKCYQNVQNKHGDTPLHIACRNSNRLCEVLLEAYCDVNITNKEGNTPLHIAVSIGNFDITQLLISDPQVKPGLKNYVGDTLLHVACKSRHATPEMVNYILAVVKSDPNSSNNDGMTPIQLTSNAQIIHELIRYGAHPTDVYSTNRVVKSKNPPQPLVKVFVVGNPSVGKSTLIAALQKELSRIVKVFTTVKKVSGVDEKTAGIIPYEFESKKYGQVTLYDFAGQKEFYSSHAALLQNSIESSPPVFLIVVNLSESYDEIKRNVLYWLSFLENQCTSVSKGLKPHVIVIGSHADILESKGESTQEKAGIINHIKTLPHFKSVEVVDFIAMDCQYSTSSGMKRLRHQLKGSCEKLRIKETIRFNTHCFLIYLLDKFRDFTAVTLDQLFAQVRDEQKAASESNPLFFLPDSLPSLFDLCSELNDRGHILFLKDSRTLINSWVVLKKESLLNEVLGTIFAPEGLKQYCALASNTGVVPTSTLRERFPNYDLAMLVGFLTHLEFCHEVTDEEVLQLINEESQSSSNSRETNSTMTQEYLFFPAFVKLEAPGNVWKHRPELINHSGWMLKCSYPEQFFTSRLLEVLILRLAFSCALRSISSGIDKNLDMPIALQRKCTVWKNGIYWGDGCGIETLVEITSDNKAVVVTMRCFQESLTAYLHLRSFVIRKVLDTVSELCAKVSTVEYFIDPSETKTYPVDPKTIFSAQDVYNAIVLRSAKSVYIVSESGESLPLESLLIFEPYSYVGSCTLSNMFPTDDSLSNVAIPERSIALLAKNFAQKEDVFLKLLSGNKEQADVSKVMPSRQEDLASLLLRWKADCEGTYHCLRQMFDRYSVCAGRNLLVSLLISCKE